MKSVFSKKSSQVHLQRNAFDLSHSDVFSIAPGMLLPIHVSEVNPNEHFVISPANYVRTMPLNSAAFTRLKQHIEFYFVPMRTLCRQFNQFIVGTEYKISSLTSLNNYKESLPSFDLISQLKGISSNHDNNLFGLPLKNDIIRLYDMLGYGVNSINVSRFDEVTSSFMVNPFRFLAYQKIYFDHYRNPLYELNDPTSYNVDSSFGSPSFSLATSMNVLRYRNWNKDYFTSLSPSFQGADYLTDVVDMSSVLNLEDNSYLKGHDFLPSTSTDLTWNGNSVPASSTVGSLSRPDNSGLVFNIANLRAAYALDKLYRISIAAGDGDYGSQIKAHYGFDAVHDDWKSQFIGGCSAPIQISEVITTATTADNSGELLATSGDIKGKGVSLNQGSFTFDTREHGIIMGILSIVPEADYQSSMLDTFNTKSTREQYFQPEFQDLGKQPINSSELSLYVYGSTPQNPQAFIVNNVIGFTNRYMEYKTCVNKVHGSFNSAGTLSAWASPRNNPLFVSENYSSVFITKTSLKVDPRILNPIMAVSYDGSEPTDPFICDCHVSVEAVRPMSVSGEPML